MTELGATLRETRIREKIDIGTVEQATKIRAKYLRALEHEEWGLLPGPTYAKSFLRTYAEYLGLDAHMLVEQYRAQFERPEELELPAFGRPKRPRRRLRFPGPPSSAATVAIAAAGLIGFLLILGLISKPGDDNSGASPGGLAQPPAGATGTSDSGKGKRAKKKARAGGGRALAVSVVATRDVWVCLVDARGKALIGGRTIAAGEQLGPFKSTRFSVTLGNGGGDLKVNGRVRPTPESAAPQGFAISRSGTRPLPDAKRPTCAAGQTGATRL